MKTTRIIALVLAAALLLLLPLAACQRSGANTPEPVDTPPTVDPPAPVDLPPTDTLVLYISEAYESLMLRPIERYKELYDVEVEIVRVEGGFEEYTERVTGDLAGGRGPDILFFDYLDMDIAKVALMGNFLDLTDILAGDREFSEDDYIDNVFDSGRFGGRQYTIPTSFYSPLYLSVKSKLEELGFSWDQVQKTSDFLEEISRLTPYAGQNAAVAQMLESKNYFEFLFMASGISLLDYENNVVLPDEEAVRDFLHAYKLYFPYDYDESGMTAGSTFGADSLIGGEFLFWLASISIADLTANLDKIEQTSYVYELYSLPSQTGDIVGRIYGQMAIRANSKNQLNAYNYIKMMLSEDIQSNRRLLAGCVPINKEAIKMSVYGLYEWEFSYKGNTYKEVGYQSTELSDEEIDALIEKIIKVDRFTQPISFNLRDMMFDSMLPFFKDEKSYDDCLAELRNKLTFYLSE